MRKILYKRMHHYKATLKAYSPLLWPTYVSLLVYAALMIINQAVLRTLNDADAITSMALVYKIRSIPILFFAGFSNILSVLAVQASVNNDYTKATEALKATLFCATMLGLGATGICYFFPSFINRLSQGESIAKKASTCLSIMTISLAPVLFGVSVRKYLRGIAWTRSSMLLTCLGGGVNVFFSYVLVNGKYGFPNMGLLGVAWATVIADVLIFLSCTGYFFFLQKKGFVVFAKRNLLHVNFKMLKQVLLLGIPLGIELAASTFYLGLVNQKITGQLGDDVNKAVSFLTELLRPFRTLGISISIVATILIGKAWKEGNEAEQRRIQHIGYVLTILGSIGSSLVFFFSYPLLAVAINPIFAKNPTQTKIVADLLPWITPLLLFESLSLLNIGFLSGRQDTLAPCVITIMSYLVFGWPLSWFLGTKQGWGVPGLFTGNIIAFIAMMIFCNQRLRKWHTGTRSPIEF